MEYWPSPSVSVFCFANKTLEDPSYFMSKARTLKSGIGLPSSPVTLPDTFA